jgi:hypothetical protein
MQYAQGYYVLQMRRMRHCARYTYERINNAASAKAIQKVRRTAAGSHSNSSGTQHVQFFSMICIVRSTDGYAASFVLNFANNLSRTHAAGANASAANN